MGVITMKVTNHKRVSALLGFRPQIVKSHLDSSEQKSAERGEIHCASKTALRKQKPAAREQDSTARAELTYESMPGARAQLPVHLPVVEFVREYFYHATWRFIFARVK